MTEEIIVNDVNVAGCEYFRENRCFDCGNQAICCQHPNCYYKQLKRLEQENKTLKANASVIQEYITKNEQLKTNIDSLAKKCCKYRSALEEIREIAEKYKDMEGCRIPLGAIKMTVDEVLQ